MGEEALSEVDKQPGGWCDEAALVNALEELACERNRLRSQLQSLQGELEVQEASMQACKDRLCVNYASRIALSKKLRRLGGFTHEEEDPSGSSDLLGRGVIPYELD